MAEEQAQDQVDVWIPEGSEPPPPLQTPQWQGRRTELVVARNTLRGPRDEHGNPTGDPYLVGAGERIQFHATRDPATGRWYGPEAAHVENLIQLGCIAGTPRAREVDADIARMEYEWGATGPDAEHPELRQFTRDRLYQTIRHFIDGGLEGRKAMDRAESRADQAAKEQAEAVRDLASAIRGASAAGQSGEATSGFDINRFLGSMTDEQADALAQALLARRRSDPLVPEGDFPGAEGPGSNPTARAARQRAAREKE